MTEPTTLWMEAFSWLGLAFVVYRALFVGPPRSLYIFIFLPDPIRTCHTTPPPNASRPFLIFKNN